MTERNGRAGREPGPGSGEEGFLLLGAIIAIFLVLLVLSVAAPTMARQMRREREVESLHRGDQYVRAIRLYYKKFGHYPGTMEQLEKSNNIRFLRHRYVDPMTGKADWRLIHLGEQKTTVKGFFGQPLAGLPTPGLGSGSLGSPPASGATSSFSLGGSPPSSSMGGALSSGSNSPAGSGALQSGAGSGGAGSGGAGTGGIPSSSATTFAGSGAPFLGVGSSAGGDSMVVVNEQTTYPTWEFIYDPRIEQMKARVNLLGGGIASSGGSGLGSGSNPPANTPTPPLTPQPPR